MIRELGDCLDATNSRITAARSNFRQLLPIITNRGVPSKTRGNIFSSCIRCIRKILLYGCEIWPASSKTVKNLKSADNDMVRWICGVRLNAVLKYKNFTKSSVLSVFLKRFSVLMVYAKISGHHQWMNKIAWPRRMNDFIIIGSLLKGRPHLHWNV